MKTHIKKIAERMLDKYLLPCTSFQDYVNTRFNKTGYEVINKQFLEGSYFEYNGLKFEINDQLDSFNSVMEDYRFSDIRMDDIVLDIGANIGMFSLLAAQKAKHVVAVEPLYPDLLKRNLKINNITNVTVFDWGVGKKLKNWVKYGRRQKYIEVFRLGEMLEYISERLGVDHCDFLKMDCEGCEWSITADELKNFRRIEAEIHLQGHNIMDFEEILLEAGFEYELEDRWRNFLIHAKKKGEK